MGGGEWSGNGGQKFHSNEKSGSRNSRLFPANCVEQIPVILGLPLSCEDSILRRLGREMEGRVQLRRGGGGGDPCRCKRGVGESMIISFFVISFSFFFVTYSSCIFSLYLCSTILSPNSVLLNFNQLFIYLCHPLALALIQDISSS